MYGRKVCFTMFSDFFSRSAPARESGSRVRFHSGTSGSVQLDPTARLVRVSLLTFSAGPTIHCCFGHTKMLVTAPAREF